MVLLSVHRAVRGGDAVVCVRMAPENQKRGDLHHNRAVDLNGPEMIWLSLSKKSLRAAARLKSLKSQDMRLTFWPAKYRESLIYARFPVFCVQSAKRGGR